MRALLIWNPVAGGRPVKGRKKTVQSAALRLERHGWRVEVAETDPRTGARAPARRGIKQQFDVLLACGGDGTLAQVASEIAHELHATGGPRRNGPIPCMGLLPNGTANVFAREFGLAFDPETAAEQIARGHVQRVPIGIARFGDGRLEYFIAVASAGFDAHVVAELSPEFKRRLGRLSFALIAMRESLRYPFPVVDVTVDRKHFRATQVIMGLTHFYAGAYRLGPARERSTAVTVVLQGGRRTIMAHSGFMLAGKLHQAPCATWHQARQVIIDGPPVRVELDGETAGVSPVTFEVVPDALPVLLPERHT